MSEAECVMVIVCVCVMASCHAVVQIVQTVLKARPQDVARRFREIDAGPETSREDDR